ncbi:MAG TPA: hypothetical protein VM266_11690, partial [Solirubrobacteraceae bacterium]|nr:hypothetical protein [Solirubrobacteraceae bacterium]
MADADDTAWPDLTRHEAELATVRMFARQSGAVRVTALLDIGAGTAPLLLEAEPGAPVTITLGEAVYVVPDEALDDVAPLPVAPPPRPVPATAISVDAAQGEVAAPLGAVASLGAAVLALARSLGGRSVAMADFPTASGEPLSIAARDGEPLVLAMGEHQFEFDAP